MGYFSNDLLLPMRHGDNPKRGPIYLEISPTGACNFNCIDCQQNHHKKAEKNKSGSPRRIQLVFERISALVDEAAGIGVENIELCGRGEPLLYPRIKETLSLIKRKRLKGSLITNGANLDNEMAELLTGIQFDEVIVSLYAGTNERFFGITRADKRYSLHGIITNIKNLNTLSRGKINITLNYLLRKDNIEELEKVIYYAYESQIRNLVFTIVFPYSRLNRLSEPWLKKEKDYLIKRLTRLILRVNKKGKDIIPRSLMQSYEQYNSIRTINTLELGYKEIPCYAPWWAMFLAEDGTVRPCSNSRIILGDIYKSALKDIWHSQAYAHFRKLAYSYMSQHKKPIPGCYCVFCGWYGINAQMHRVINDPNNNKSNLESSVFQDFLRFSS